MSKPANLPSECLSAYERYQELCPEQVKQFVGLKHTRSIWRYVSEGKLPPPRYLAPHKPIWRLGEVLDHTHALMQKPSKAVQGFKGESLEVPVTPSKSKVKLLKERLGLK